MSNGKTLAGGRRPGSGRKRKGTERRVSLSLSVDRTTKEMYRSLMTERRKAFLLDLELYIIAAYQAQMQGQRLLIVPTSDSDQEERILEIMEKDK